MRGDFVDQQRNQRLRQKVAHARHDAQVGAGNVVGGACGIAAAEKANGRVVTVAIEAMKFIRPVKVGDVLCVYTAIGHVGRTSMQIHVEAWARRFHSHHREKVTEATFTFVAVDDAGRPRPVLREAGPIVRLPS